MIRKIAVTLLALAGLTLAGCGEYGNVEQGRTIAFDAAKKEVTIIKDAGIDDRHPQYTVLPPHKFLLPTDPAEVGPLPKAGLRVQINLEDKKLIMLDPATQTFEEIAFEMVANHEKVSLERKHPLVFDAATNKARPFPKVDKEASTVTIYSRRQGTLSTIKVPPAVLEKYTEAQLDAGDEVRIYYRDPGKALRFMNVSQTNIFRR